MYRFSNIHLSNVIITKEIQKAITIHITKALKYENFTGSNDWLQKFKKRFNIKKINVDINTVEIEI